MEQCSGCRFWLNWDSEQTNLGECHRYPPRMATIHRTDAEGTTTITVRPEEGGWPLTAPDDWCGEYQRPLTGAGAGASAAAPRAVDVGPGGI
jgi:hypothetical protein